MYDVVFLDHTHRRRVLAGGLGHDHAVALARDEARRLRVGRMFLCGSEPAPRGDVVLIVASANGQQHAA